MSEGLPTSTAAKTAVTTTDGGGRASRSAQGPGRPGREGGSAGSAHGGGHAARRTPRGYGVLRLGNATFLWHRRATFAAVVLAVALAAVCLAYLCTGESFTSPIEAIKVLLGQPSKDELVVGTLRLPRMTVGLLVGAAFGVSGALIQTVARNPLASPDIIGISQGAGAVTVAALTFGVTSYTVLPYLSVAGGVLAALLVYAFAWRGACMPPGSS